MKPALRANEDALKARTIEDHDPQDVPPVRYHIAMETEGAKATSTILHVLHGIHDLRFWQDGCVIKIKDTIVARATKAIALPEAFHRLTPDEQATFYIFLSSC